jgi:nitroreductase
MKSILEEMNWRYATKKFDPSKKISAEQLDVLLEVVRLAPTSYGLQPFKVIVIQSPEIREQLLPFSFGQRQVVEASHVLVFCAETQLDSTTIDQYIERIATTRNQDETELQGYKSFMNRTLLDQEEDSIVNWHAKQVYLAVGMFLQSCSKLKIDATPMEGFNADGYSDVLQLNALHLHPVIVCPIGYRSADDSVQHLKKVRKEGSEMIIQLD